MKYFRELDDYIVVFDVMRSDGKCLGVVEYDHNPDEMAEDIARLLKLSKITFHKQGDSDNMDVWCNGKVVAEVYVDAPYYRPKRTEGDQCRSCGTVCDLHSFAWVCPFHGVQS